MIKPVSKVFEEQFWRELSTKHATHNKIPSVEVEDAVVLHLSTQNWREKIVVAKKELDEE